VADHTFVERDFALGHILRHSCLARQKRGGKKPGHSLPEARRKMGQSRITNGALLVGTDGRGPWQRRAGRHGGAFE
jgi:hypothetical protein